MDRSFADLHCHTDASFDSLSRPAAVVKAAVERGLTHLAITDHDRIDAALAARDAAPNELTVIVGQEVRTRTGDLIALYVNEAIPPGLGSAEAATRVRDQGGLVGIAHPFDRFRAGAGRRGWEAELDSLTPLLDFVEIWNARLFMGNGNTLAAEFAATHHLPGVAVSDAHTVLEVGVAYTILEGRVSGPEEMREALATAAIVTAKGSRAVRVAMPVAKLIQRMRGNRRVVAA